MPINSWIVGGIALIAIVFYKFRGTDKNDKTEPELIEQTTIDNQRFIGRRIRRSRKYWTPEN
jgi:hypothetical protein